MIHEIVYTNELIGRAIKKKDKKENKGKNKE